MGVTVIALSPLVPARLSSGLAGLSPDDLPLVIGALWEPTLRLGVCGDWCRGARIEDAFLSGHAAAGRILGCLAGLAATG